ncbi:MAG: hypothetical protein M3076_15310 [Actinomycetota bacterium]|nr:hypothetical protein [Actinomycetota bacterium]
MRRRESPVSPARSAAAETLPLSAGLIRRSSTSILGYTIYGMLWTAKRETFRQLAEHGAAGRLVIELEVLPLACVADAWERQSRSPHRQLVLKL